jgi:hypothetical protein
MKHHTCTVLLVTAVFLLSAAVAFGQTVSFNRQESSGFGAVWAQVDLNGDGALDLITRCDPPPDQDCVGRFIVQLNNGHGVFGAPVFYSSNSRDAIEFLAVGDFNRDGKIDLVVAAGGATPGIDMFLGNGDGTFRAPVRQAMTLGAPRVTADFDKDGKLDLAFVGPSSSHNQIFIALGRGDGTFSTPTVAYTTVGFIENLVTGDFDGDSFPDLATDDVSACNNSICTYRFYALYGTGTGSFTSDITIAPDSVNSYNPADVNKDGRTDLLSIESCATQCVVQIRYGTASRTFTTRQFATASRFPGTPVTADFNGDGLNDILYPVIEPATASTTNKFLAIHLGKADGTFSTAQKVASPVGDFPPHVGDYNRDGKPDLLGISLDPNSQITLHVWLNTTIGSFPTFCAPPASPGVHVCGLSEGIQVNSPVTANATAKPFAFLYRFELWVDNAKVYTAREDDRIFTKLNLQPGEHTFVFQARNGVSSNNSSEQYTRALHVVVSPCTPPVAEGIHVCSPMEGSTYSHTQSVRLSAAARLNGTFYRLEVWVDGVKKWSVKNNVMDVYFDLPIGKHRFDYVARNTTGTRIVKTVFATVN